ncbi:MAG: type II secretion system GspH family protein [Acidimicrobiia bacterium]|nr:type II secretion system GspH family protein [Acidimicrobiia bacterium]
MGTVARRRGAGGFTLPEMIVTIAILGIAIVGMVGGLFGLVVARETHRQVARAGAYVLTYAEAVKAAAYEDCTTSGAYSGVTAAAPSYELTVLAVECWNGDQPATFTAGSAPGAVDSGAQRVALSVSGPTGAPASKQVTETVVVLKRNAAAPT